MPRPTNALIVDDEAHVRVLIRVLLKQLGIETVWEAPDGATAYVLNTDNGVGTTQASLSPINTTTNTAGKPIDVGPGPSALAIAP